MEFREEYDIEKFPSLRNLISKFNGMKSPTEPLTFKTAYSA